MGYWCFGYGFYRWYGLVEIHTTAVTGGKPKTPQSNATAATRGRLSACLDCLGNLARRTSAVRMSRLRTVLLVKVLRSG